MKETKFIPSNVKPDWEIGTLYKKSWEFIKKNKVSWIFGSLVAGATSSFSGGSHARLNSKDLKDFQDIFNNFSSPKAQSFNTVLGNTTSSFSETLGHIFSQIPIFFYVALGIEVIALILVGIVISLVLKAWAEASLLQTIELSIDKKEVSITNASHLAFKSIKSLLWLYIVPSGILFVSAGIVFLILVLLIVKGPIFLRIVSIGIMVISILIVLLLSLFLSYARVWAVRKVVIDKKQAKEALFGGLKIAKKKFWAMSLLGFVNGLAAFFVIGIPIGILAALLLGGVFSYNSNAPLAISLIVTGAISILLFLCIMPLLTGVITAFKAAVWSFAYKNIRGKYDTK